MLFNNLTRLFLTHPRQTLESPFLIVPSFSFNLYWQAVFGKRTTEEVREKGSPGKDRVCEYLPISMTTTCQSFPKGWTQWVRGKRKRETTISFGESIKGLNETLRAPRLDSILLFTVLDFLLLPSFTFLEKLLISILLQFSYVSLIIHNHFLLLFHHPRLHPLLHPFLQLSLSLAFIQNWFLQEKKEKKITFSHQNFLFSSLTIHFCSLEHLGTVKKFQTL